MGGNSVFRSAPMSVYLFCFFSQYFYKTEIGFYDFQILVAEDDARTESSYEDGQCFIFCVQHIFGLFERGLSCFQVVFHHLELFEYFFRGVRCFTVSNLGVCYAHFGDGCILGDGACQASTGVKPAGAAVHFFVVVTGGDVIERDFHLKLAGCGQLIFFVNEFGIQLFIT
jgi:hypothetical protein